MEAIKSGSGIGERGEGNVASVSSSAPRFSIQPVTPLLPSKALLRPQLVY